MSKRQENFYHFVLHRKQLIRQRDETNAKDKVIRKRHILNNTKTYFGFPPFDCWGTRSPRLLHCGWVFPDVSNESNAFLFQGQEPILVMLFNTWIRVHHDSSECRKPLTKQKTASHCRKHKYSATLLRELQNCQETPCQPSQKFPVHLSL